MIKYIFLALPILLFIETASLAQTTSDIEKRQAYLDELLEFISPHPDPAVRDRNVFSSFVRLSYKDHTWDDWLERTGELPPNFEEMPSIPFLPDPLIIDEGGENIPVETLSQWEEKREWIKDQAKHILTGTFPPPPENMEINILEERIEDGVKVEMVELRFGEHEKAKLTLEVMTPPGDGPFPVFMTQWNHRGWAQIAVRRGYIGLIYAGADNKDDTEGYQEVYPDYDWTILTTRAWGAHRAVDYLYTLDSVDKAKIGLTGHSRNGKLSIIAGAFDERITAVISSSAGTGGEIPYRYTGQRYESETLDLLLSIRPQWIHPRLRFYTGREHKMPIDQNSLMSLIAPNSLLLSFSIRESGAGAWAIEESYHSLSKVYDFLEQPEKLGILSRDGEHGVSARDIERYVDWLDIQFGRKSLPWDNKLHYDYSFEEWKVKSDESINPDDLPDAARLNNIQAATVSDWESDKEEIKKHINWILGDEPGGVKADPIEGLSSREDYMNSFLRRPRVSNGRSGNIAPYNALGDYQYGSLYYPTDDNGDRLTGENDKVPVVVFLHRYSNMGFDSSLSSLFDDLLSRGIAVLAMDMIGYGSRIEEGTLFYDRYPNWSKIGKMVTDTRAAIDALEDIVFIDDDKIFLSGFALGGTVSLFTAALDERVAGTAVSGAFTPLRNAEANKDNEGIKHYSHLHGLLPRLGFFDGNEDKLPVDFPEILSAIAPRPLYVISPTLDRHVNNEEISRSIQDVSSIYDLFEAPDNLQLSTPFGISKFTSEQQSDLADWLEEMTDQ